MPFLSALEPAALSKQEVVAFLHETEFGDRDVSFDRARNPQWKSIPLYASPVPAEPSDRPTGHVVISHDGFSGDIIGHYVTREGKRGVVVQQDGTRVVHVYGEKWLAPAPHGEGA